jgi:hypothetical protein
MLWFCILITRPWLVDVSRIKDNLEIKRMFVLPEVRGRVKVFEMNNGVRVFLFSFGTQIAETEAIGMYQKCGYTVIDN